MWDQGKPTPPLQLRTGVTRQPSETCDVNYEPGKSGGESEGGPSAEVMKPQVEIAGAPQA